MKTMNWQGIVGAVPIVLLVGYLCYGGESYCIVYPGIDTRYAVGFSERAFEQVAVGMTEGDVRRLLGDPLDARALKGGTTRWSYTNDGKCLWTDWAWLGREIVFKNGRVVERVARVYYD